MTKYCIDAEGNYIGAFDEIPDGAFVVDTPPTNALHKWDGEKFVEPIEIARERAVQSINKFANDITDAITSKYPKAEVDAWVEKKQESRNLIAAESPVVEDYPLLMSICIIENGTENLLDNMIAKANAVVYHASKYIKIVALVEGIRSKTDAILEAATTAEEVDQALEAAKLEAEAVMKSEGI